MPRPNDTIGPYTLIRKLGSGGFGVVWLAEKRSQLLTTKVALKIARDDSVDLSAIKREAAVWLEAAGHPNILPIIDADIYDDEAVIVSEYAPGGSLTGWLLSHGGKAPSIESALTMIEGVLSGLEHLHTRNIIHRDLKPDNILLAGSTPRLADFGIARVLKTTGPYTTVISGTPQYMAPETYRNMRSERADLWSVAVILYQLLAGCCPFKGDDYPSLMYSVLNEDPKPFSESIPSSVQDVISRGLVKKPEGRYQTAREMREAIRSIAFVAGEQKPPSSDPNAVTITDPRPGATGTTSPEEETLIPIITRRPLRESQFEYWTELNRLLRKNNSVVRLEPARGQSSIRGFLGHPKAELFAAVSVKDRKLSTGIRIFNRPDLYAELEKEKDRIEPLLDPASGEDLSWRPRKNYQTISEISLSLHGVSIEWRERWEEYLEWHARKLEAFYKAVDPRLRRFKDLARPLDPRTESRAQLVRKFWDGFEVRRAKAQVDLNPPYIPESGRGKSNRTKSLGRGFRLAVQLNSSKDYVDVNITVGASQHSLFQDLHSQRSAIENAIGQDLEWRSNPSGESWVLVRRDFILTESEEWGRIYEWLLDKANLFLKVFSERIELLAGRPVQALNARSRTEPPKADQMGLLRRVGMDVFIRYLDDFEDRSLTNNQVADLLPHEYTYKSRYSRTFKARKILEAGLKDEALQVISLSERVDPEIKRRAHELLLQTRPHTREGNREKDNSETESTLVRARVEAPKPPIFETGTKQYWIVLWGDPEHSADEDAQVFDEPFYDQGLPRKPEGMRVGDILFVHRIHISKIIFVGEVVEPPRISSEEEVNEEEWRQRWRWSVRLKNLTPDYGRVWRQLAQRTFTLKDRYNALNPDDPVNIGRLQHGLHVRIPEAFANFLMNEIEKLH